jgi:aryl-alcohol dehydrogenase-like predicted oxidoreductase
MKLRQLLGTRLEVSELGLGCARIGGIFQGDPAPYFELLSVAREAGINFFDTADIYSQGESESLLGRAFRGRRDQVVIASKAGYRLPSQRKLASRLKPLLRPLIRRLGIRRDRLPAAVRGTLSQDFSPKYLRRAVEASLRRLRTDYLDLLQLHSPPAEQVQRGEWSEALEALKRTGKIRYYGISCDDEAAGLAALAFAGVSTLQLRVNLLDQEAAERLVPRARARGVGVIARESLANGQLVKPLSELDLSRYCSSPEQAQARASELEELRERATREGRSLGRLAVDYARGIDGIGVTLLGASNPVQLRTLLREVT